MFTSINKTFGCCSKIFGCSNQKLFVVPNFVAVTKPFFSVCFGNEGKNGVRCIESLDRLVHRQSKDHELFTDLVINKSTSKK